MFQYPGCIRKNFIPQNFSWRVAAETWDASCFKKGLLEKQQCSKQLHHIAIEKELKACIRYFSLFLKDKCTSSLFQTKYIEKKFNLQLFFPHCFMNIYSLRGCHVLPASLKLLV